MAFCQINLDFSLLIFCEKFCEDLMAFCQINLNFRLLIFCGKFVRVGWPCQIHLRTPRWGDSQSLTFRRKTSVSRDQGFVKSSLTLQIAAMSSSDLRARMDGLEGLSKADAVYPEPLSRHNRSPIVAQQVRIPYKCGKHQKGPRRPKKGLKGPIYFQTLPGSYGII